MKKKSEISFDRYVSDYDKKIAGIRYKYTHSYRVEKLMKKLATKLKLSKEEIKIAELIGLLHDIGRFEQIKKYGLSSDSKTHVDHADESCIYLFDSGHIRDYIEDSKYDDIIKDAIKNHNKYIMDDKLKGKNLFFAKMIRDMDKTDILYQVSVNYDLQFVEKPSEGVVETFKKGESIRKSMKKNKSDSIVMTFAFFNDIYFKDTYEILKENDNFGLYVSSIEVSKENEELFKEIVNRCYEQIDGEVVKC
jgi:HD superfamily phosphohydrolase YqeK